MMNNIGNLSNSVAHMTLGAANTVNGQLPTKTGGVSMLGAMSSAAGSMIGAAQHDMGDFASQGTHQMQGMQSSFGSVAGNAMGAATGVANSAKAQLPPIKSGGAAMLGSMSSAAGSLIGAAQHGVGDFTSQGTHQVQGMQSSFGSVAGNAMGAAAGVANTAKAQLTQIKSGGATMLGAAQHGMGDFTLHGMHQMQGMQSSFASAAGASMGAVGGFAMPSMGHTMPSPMMEIPQTPIVSQASSHNRKPQPPKTFYPVDEDQSIDEVNVDEMKMQTMYKMVDDCKVSIQGRDISKKVLYLTNKQASLFDENTIERCIQAMEIPNPKFVIKLCASTGVESVMFQAHQELWFEPFGQFVANETLTSEIDPLDERAVESQALLFLRTCILPLAKQTRALILIHGSNNCFLSYALSTIVIAEQARLGKSCPFTVIATVREYEIHSRATGQQSGDNKSLAAQLASQVPAWRRRLERIDSILHRSVDGVFQRCDLSSAASHYIVFESIDEDKSGDIELASVNPGQYKSFDSAFIQYLTKKLPCIAIQSHCVSNGIQYLADLLARKIPVLILDATERAVTSRKNILKNPIATVLAKKSKAFPWIPTSRLEKVMIKENSVTLGGRRELLTLMEEMLIRKWEVLIANGVGDSLEASYISFFHSALTLGASLHASKAADATKPVALYERISELEKLQRANKDAKKSLIPTELATIVIDFILTQHPAYAKAAQLNLVKRWLSKHNSKVDRLVPQAEELRDELEYEVGVLRQDGMILRHLDVDPVNWLSLFEILTSPNAYSGSLHDVDNLKNILGSVARIDRLPAMNTLEALRLLRDSWDHVELYHEMARFYKVATNVAYITLLVVSVAITFMIMVETNYSIQTKLVVIVLSFVNSGVVSYLAFVNPMLKWQRLRVAALTIESNIWQFRTRTGPYKITTEAYDQDSEIRFANCLQELKDGLLEGADLKTSSFYSRRVSIPLHGQREGFENQSTSFVKSVISRITSYFRNELFCTCFRPNRAKAARIHTLDDMERGAGLGSSSRGSSTHAANATADGYPDEEEICILELPSVANLIQTVLITDPMYPRDNEFTPPLPLPAPVPAPAPASVPAPAPASVPASVPVSAPVPALASAPEPETASIPITSPAATPALVPNAAAPLTSQSDPTTTTTTTAAAANPNSMIDMNALSSATSKVLDNVEHQFNQITQVVDSTIQQTVIQLENGINEITEVVGNNIVAPMQELAQHVAHLHPPHLMKQRQTQGQQQQSQVPTTDTCISMVDLVSFLKPKHSIEGEAIDNHYDPVQPNHYIKFRLWKAIAFYEGRIPRYNRTRYVSQTLLITGSLATGAISYFNLSVWSAVITIITSAITAYLEFNGTNGKMTRYSSIVHNLRHLILWWDSLPPIDRAVVSNVDYLIGSGEELLLKEMQSWQSSGQSKPKKKDSDSDDDDSDDNSDTD